MLTLTRKEFVGRVNAEPAFAKLFEESSSPGPVADWLGVSRQRVHQMLITGKLDGAKIVDADGTTAFVVIFDRSVRRVLRERAHRAA